MTTTCLENELGQLGIYIYIYITVMLQFEFDFIQTNK